MPRASAISLPPEILEPVRRQRRIDRRRRDRPVPEPPLDCPGVVPPVRQRVAAGVAEHVRMSLQLKTKTSAGRSLNHRANPAVVNGVPRSLTKTNATACSHAVAGEAHATRHLEGDGCWRSHPWPYGRALRRHRSSPDPSACRKPRPRAIRAGMPPGSWSRLDDRIDWTWRPRLGPRPRRASSARGCEARRSVDVLAQLFGKLRLAGRQAMQIFPTKSSPQKRSSHIVPQVLEGRLNG